MMSVGALRSMMIELSVRIGVFVSETDFSGRVICSIVILDVCSRFSESDSDESLVSSI